MKFNDNKKNIFRPAICYMDSQPVRYESNNKKSEILFKTMVKSRARNLIKFTRQR